MSSYRYVVFPVGAAPSAEEVARLEAYSELLDYHIAYGKRRGDGGLAIACDAEPFDRLRGLDPAFDELLLKWRVRGGEVVEKLAFVKDAALWKKLRPAPEKPPSKPERDRHYASDGPTDAVENAERLQEATEAEGGLRLEVDHASEMGRRYESAGGWLPYLLWGSGAIAMLMAGGYVANRLLDSPIETRAETVERVAGDALGESLAQETVD